MKKKKKIEYCPNCLKRRNIKMPLIQRGSCCGRKDKFLVCLRCDYKKEIGERNESIRESIRNQ